MGHGCQNGFYFDYGHDVIEEAALNEKHCKQVLKILIEKADADIVELEEELVILQHQLAWADEEWSELCFAFLTEKISCLDILIHNLKNKEDDIGNCSQLHWDPVKRIDDIVKALFSDYLRQKNEQPDHAVVDDSFARCASPLYKEKLQIKIELEEAIQNEANAALELRLLETALLEKVEPADTSLNFRSEAFKEVSKEAIKPEQSTGLDVASEKRDKSNSLLGNGNKRTKPPGRVHVPYTQDKRKMKSKSNPTKQQRQQLKQVRKADVTTEDKGSDSYLSCKQGSCRRKEAWHLNPEGIQEPSLSVELGLSSSSTEKYKFLLSRKITKARARSDMYDARELISLSQKRRKVSSSSLDLLEGNKELKSHEVSLAKFHGDSKDSTQEEYLSTESHFVDCSSSSKLTLIDLKAIAKERLLKGYSKLGKPELARLLGITYHIRGGKNEDGTSFANEADPLIFSS